MRWLYDTPEGPRDATPSEIYDHAYKAAQVEGGRGYLIALESRFDCPLKVELGGQND